MKPISGRNHLATGLLVAAGLVGIAQTQNLGRTGSLGRTGLGKPTLAVGEKIDFESFQAGEIVSSVYGDQGSGPITILGTNPALGSVNAAIVFDSAYPTSIDLDLGTPNEMFGGPGQGTGGAMGSPYVNAYSRGKVLIVAEDLTDLDNDGRIDVPNDSETPASELFFDFSSLGTVTVGEFSVIDVGNDGLSASVELFDETGASLGTTTLPAVGENGVSRIRLTSQPGVASMSVMLNGSGALDAIRFNQDGVLGDLVFCDEDNDGVFDPGEPGIEGVTIQIRCAGGDGLLGTADDTTDSTVTDVDGKYLFTQAPAGLCRVRLDASSVPAGKALGQCPTNITVQLAPGGSMLGADFCLTLGGVIGDTVFCDLDNDGVQDAGEPGIEGVKVDLACTGPDGVFGTADDQNSFEITDANGNYLFEDVPSQTCAVTIDPASVPAGKTFGLCPSRFGIDMQPGVTFLDADFCFITPGQIGDTVFCDLDNDGVQDPGEPGIAGVDVELTCAGGDGLIGTADDFFDTTTTDANGFYLFDNLTPDLCQVSVDPATAPTGKVQGICPTEFMVDLRVTSSFLDADFCYITPGEIGGKVFCDLDLDGVLDPGEPGIPGVQVDLVCLGPDGLPLTADDYFDWMLTDANGCYLFEDVPPGTCTVNFLPSTFPAPKVPNCPVQLVVALGAGQSVLDANFCLIDPPGEIGDTVYCDLDNDGVQDPGEPGIEGAIVNLTCAGIDWILGTADDLTDSMTTDANGNYLFTNVPAGMCQVELDVNSGPSGKIVGVCPPSLTLILAPDESFLDADFCFSPPDPGALGDLVYCDLDDDGVQDPGEPGIPGVTVDLVCTGADGVFGTADDILDSRVTDANGAYLFEEVEPGDCVAIVDVTSAPPDKSLGQCPSFFEVTLGPGDSFLDADFCFTSDPAEIGDLVWCDLNDDGDLDPGEPGVPGVTVNLTCAGPDGLLGTGDDLVDSMVTDANGMYLFTDIPAPDTCRVDLDVSSIPPDKLVGRCPTSVTAMLDPGDSFLDADFCLVTPGEIGDTVYCDEDDDGVQDPGEAGIPDAPVSLACAGPDGILGTGDDYTDATTTDANGNYLFTDVPPGVCQVDLDTTFVVVGKEIGMCPTSVGLVLAPAESFLDADFCYRNNPPEDCCENGKPQVLTMLYTGDDCSATSHSQDPGKVNCDGDPAFAPMVIVRATEKEDPFDTGGKIYFEDVVNLGEAYDIDATVVGDSELRSKTFVHIFDLSGGLLQTVEFHTSCSQPLFTGDQFGANLLIDCIGKDEPPPPGSADSCDDGDPQVLTMRYTGEDCSASSNSQDPDKVSCSGDPAFAATVHILASDDQDPDDTGANVWFEGDVDLNTTFDIDALAAGENKLKSNTWVHIFDPQTGATLQTIEFHTSCSQPLSVGDQFGSLLLEVFTPEP